MPVSTLAANFATVAVRLSEANSPTKTAASTPSGTAITEAITTIKRVPTRALPSPPPGIPAAGGAPRTPRAAMWRCPE